MGLQVQQVEVKHPRHPLHLAVVNYIDRLVVMVFELKCSFGERPARAATAASERFRRSLVSRKTSRILMPTPASTREP